MVLSDKPSAIDVIVRVHDVARTVELEWALLSLFFQRFSPVRPIVVSQNLSKGDRDILAATVAKFDWVSRGTEPLIEHFEGEPGQDYRSRLLNVGISKAQGQYLAILDSDDFLFENAYEDLIAKLEKSRSAIAFGNIKVRDVRAFPDYVYAVGDNDVDYNIWTIIGGDETKFLPRLLAANFCPIHSFVVDRMKIAEDDLYFSEELERLEDYEFLLRICSKYQLGLLDEIIYVGVYNWHVGGSNSIVIDESDPERQDVDARIALNREKWNRALSRLWQLKTRIRRDLKLHWCATEQTQTP